MTDLSIGERMLLEMQKQTALLEEIKEKITPKRAAIKKQQIADDYTKEFEEFWNEYPAIGGSKVKAFETWTVNNLAEIKQTILEGLQHYKKTKNWQEGKYITHAVTWLNQRRWEAIPKKNPIGHIKPKNTVSMFDDEKPKRDPEKSLQIISQIRKSLPTQ